MKLINAQADTFSKFTDENLNHLINLLYPSLEDETGWEPFLQKLHALLGTQVVHMIGQEKVTKPFPSVLMPMYLLSPNLLICTNISSLSCVYSI